jgi:hypothetical protein
VSRLHEVLLALLREQLRTVAVPKVLGGHDAEKGERLKPSGVSEGSYAGNDNDMEN